jgi:energy-coupling factor transporter ATP-binding protein EcfA2
MTTTFLFENHHIVTYAGLERRLNFSDRSFICLDGPAGCGKTSVLQTMLYPLGVQSKFRRAVRENIRIASTTINIEGTSFRLVRRMDRQTNLVQVYDRHGEGRLLTLDITGRHGTTPSDWLFQRMGVAKLFADVRIGSGIMARPVGFGDILPCFYVAQEDTDRQIMRHLTHNTTRRTVFELLLGISDAGVQELKGRVADIDRRLKDLRSRIANIEDFLNDDPSDADELREELQQTVEEADNADKILKDLLRQVESARRRQARAGQRGTERWINCPRCQQRLDQRSVPASHCPVCMQPEQDQTSPPDTSDDDVQVAPDLQEVAEAHAHAARTAERVKGLRRLLDRHDRLTRLHGDLAKLQSQRVEAASALADARQAAGEHRHHLQNFSDRFNHVIQELRPPWYETEARIDYETYLPIVETDTFDEMGGGVRGTINVAYHVALLSYALVTGGTYVPSVLIVDSPRRNLGANETDRKLARRVYEHFLRLQQGDTGMGTRPFQLIVVDNDAPAAGSRGVRRITYSHADPFVPGVRYAAPSADGEERDEEDEESDQ